MDVRGVRKNCFRSLQCACGIGVRTREDDHRAYILLCPIDVMHYAFEATQTTKDISRGCPTNSPEAVSMSRECFVFGHSRFSRLQIEATSAAHWMQLLDKDGVRLDAHHGVFV